MFWLLEQLLGLLLPTNSGLLQEGTEEESRRLLASEDDGAELESGTPRPSRKDDGVELELEPPRPRSKVGGLMKFVPFLKVFHNPSIAEDQAPPGERDASGWRLPAEAPARASGKAPLKSALARHSGKGHSRRSSHGEHRVSLQVEDEEVPQAEGAEDEAKEPREGPRNSHNPHRDSTASTQGPRNSHRTSTASTQGPRNSHRTSTASTQVGKYPHAELSSNLPLGLDEVIHGVPLCKICEALSTIFFLWTVPATFGCALLWALFVDRVAHKPQLHGQEEEGVDPRYSSAWSLLPACGVVLIGVIARKLCKQEGDRHIGWKDTITVFLPGLTFGSSFLWWYLTIEAYSHCATLCRHAEGSFQEECFRLGFQEVIPEDFKPTLGQQTFLGHLDCPAILDLYFHNETSLYVQEAFRGGYRLLGFESLLRRYFLISVVEIYWACPMGLVLAGWVSIRRAIRKQKGEVKTSRETLVEVFMLSKVEKILRYHESFKFLYSMYSGEDVWYKDKDRGKPSTPPYVLRVLGRCSEEILGKCTEDPQNRRRCFRESERYILVNGRDVSEVLNEDDAQIKTIKEHDEVTCLREMVSEILAQEKEKKQGEKKQGEKKQGVQAQSSSASSSSPHSAPEPLYWCSLGGLCPNLPWCKLPWRGERTGTQCGDAPKKNRFSGAFWRFALSNKVEVSWVVFGAAVHVSVPTLHRLFMQRDKDLISVILPDKVFVFPVLLNAGVSMFTLSLIWLTVFRAYRDYLSKFSLLVCFDAMWNFPEETKCNNFKVGLSGGKDFRAEIRAMADKRDEYNKRFKGYGCPIWQDVWKWKGREKRYRLDFVAWDPKELLKEVKSVQEWYFMRKYLQLDAVDERVSLEMWSFLVAIMFLPSIMLIITNFVVLQGKLTAHDHVISFQTLIDLLAFFVIFIQVIRITLKFNKRFDHHGTQMGKLKDHISIVCANTFHDPHSSEVKEWAEKVNQVKGDLDHIRQGVTTFDQPAMLFGFVVNEQLLQYFFTIGISLATTQIVPLMPSVFATSLLIGLEKN